MVLKTQEQQSAKQNKRTIDNTDRRGYPFLGKSDRMGMLKGFEINETTVF